MLKIAKGDQDNLEMLIYTIYTVSHKNHVARFLWLTVYV